MDAYKICPQCGTQNDPQNRLCENCRKTLIDERVSGDLSKLKPERNPVARLLKICAVVIYVFAAATGIKETLSYGVISFLLRDWVLGFMAGTLLLGFSEVVRLLHEINQKK